MGGYVRGYDGREAARLEDQARTREELLHADTGFPDGSAVLEAGCGTGAQTVALARRSPGVRITAVDVSAASLAETRAQVSAAGLGNVEFRQAGTSLPCFSRRPPSTTYSFASYWNTCPTPPRRSRPCAPFSGQMARSPSSRATTVPRTSIPKRALAAGITAPDAFDAGTCALHRTAEPDRVFCYTFLKAVARSI